MYKESYLAWMQLWELEYKKSKDYFKIIEEKNDRILKQDAVILKANELLTSSERIKKEYKDLYTKEVNKNKNLKRTVAVSFIIGAVTGAIIRGQ